MKKILVLSALFISFLTSAQVPQGISYQAIALNGSGTPVVSSNVRVKLSILDSSASGTVLYSETQLKTTNPNGLFNLTIGQGTLVSGAFNTINWGVNTKFLKVEMDTTGGTNYVVVGTTQLLSVPYALAADSLVTSAGEGITLVSPNGTPYQLTVNDAGQLSLPTSGDTGTVPSSLYLYGSFNSFNPTTALLMQNDGNYFTGSKYFAAGTTLKFVSSNTANAPIYGVNASLQMIPNGTTINIPTSGFYNVGVEVCCSQYTSVFPITPGVRIVTNDVIADLMTMTSYNVGTNTASITVTGITNASKFYIAYDSSSVLGENIFAPGSLVGGGAAINFPGSSSTPKNYRIDFVMDFTAGGTFTVTQI